MRKLSGASSPGCHLTHVKNAPGTGLVAVWICEYPYRTMRLYGPSIECADCPFWQEVERAHHHKAPAAPVCTDGTVTLH
jgi:hypothetical protein